MAKFDAGLAVERLEYDFSAFGGKSGFIQEPTTGRVNGFFQSTRNMMSQVKILQAKTAGLGNLDAENMTDDELAKAMEAVDEASAGASEFQAQSVVNLAVLCGADWEDIRDGDDNIIRGDLVGGSPTFEELNALPFRVLQAFSTWLMGEIKPKRTTPGTKR